MNPETARDVLVACEEYLSPRACNPGAPCTCIQGPTAREIIESIAKWARHEITRECATDGVCHECGRDLVEPNLWAEVNAIRWAFGKDDPRAFAVDKLAEQIKRLEDEFGRLARNAKKRSMRMPEK